MKRTAILISIFLISGSCSKQYHFEKFIDKGGKIEPKIEWKTETKTDTIQGVDGKDSIVFLTDFIPFAVYDVKYVPKWRVRFDNKRFDDSLNYLKRIYSMELENALKRDKIEAKKEIKITRAENRFPWVWLMFAVGMILIGLRILKRR
jgi:hypothetical protein